MFFKRADREQNYLWGRLDAAERLPALLWASSGKNGDPQPTVEPSILKATLATVVEEEIQQRAFETSEGKQLLSDLQAKIAALPG